MVKLLHSKTFRNNLSKWFTIYICLILMLMTVVTYSRYITSQQGSDHTRTAKFSIKITKDKVCSTTSSGLCYNEEDGDLPFAFKPYDTIEYYFNVDTSKLEVLSNLKVYVDVNPDFDIKYVALDDDSEKITFNNTISTGEIDEDTTVKHISNIHEELEEGATKNNYISLTRKITSENRGVKKYKVGVKYNGENYATAHNYNTDDKKAIIIHYNAEQVAE